MRKSLLFIFTTILGPQVLYAQLDKGTWLVGGSASFASNNRELRSSVQYQSADETQLTISPAVGYFLADKFAAGLATSFVWSKINYGDVFDPNGNLIAISRSYSNEKTFSVGPFARYYFLEKERTFNILAQASYQYSLYSFRPFTGSGYRFSAVAGPVVYFNSSVGMEFLIGYGSTKDDRGTGNVVLNKSILFNVGFQIQLQ
jgi:hypothetical protein